MQEAIKRARAQDPSQSTILTGGLGDIGFGQNVSRVTVLGRTAP